MIQKSVVTACAIFLVAVTHCCVIAARCLSETMHCPKNASVQSLIPCLPRIKQVVEEFTSQIAKILTNRKVTKNRRTFLRTVEF